MKWFMKFRHDILRIAPLVIFGFVTAWCGFYLLFGSSNVFTLRALDVQQAQLEDHLGDLKSKRADVEDRVTRMRPATLDWDLVEQEAHVKLGPSPKETKSLNM